MSAEILKNNLHLYKQKKIRANYDSSYLQLEQQCKARPSFKMFFDFHPFQGQYLSIN